MIDINKIEKEFDKYTSNYDPNIPRISLKINHIKRVVKNCEKIAKSLNLNNEEISLAMAIGFFHDIGRFEQVRIADTFSDRDSKINHGEYGVKVLFEDGLIRNFIQENKYDNIIKAAVLNHNRAEIEDGLIDKELLFSKIIRDADKLDIFYTLTIESFPAIFWYKDFSVEKIDEIVLNEFSNHKLLEYKNIHNNADQILIFYAYIYDLNFKDSLKLLKEKKYLDKFTDRVLKNFPSEEVHEQMKEVSNIYHEYFNNVN